MKTKLIKSFQILLFALVGFVLLPIANVTAQSQTTTVTASIPSRACPQFSIISTNVTEALADNSQKILVSVQLKDCGQVLMQDSSVSLNTNRGAVDHADAVTATGDVVLRGFGTGVDAKTGTDGMAYFNVYSLVPGDVTVTLKADNILLLGTKDIKFLPIPFPKNISVSVTIPPYIGRLLPNYNEKTSTLPLFVPQKQQFDEAKIVNLGVDLQIPFWFFLIMMLILLAIPTLSTSNIILLRRIRKEQRVETTKIEAEVEEIHEEITAEIDKSEEAPKHPEN